MYEVLVFLHIAAAMLWVGAGALVIAMQKRAYRRGGKTAVVDVMSELEWSDRWIFTPAPLLVVATGAALVVLSDAWAFSQAWIFLALTLIVIEMVFGYRHVKAVDSVRGEGDESERLGTAVRTYLRFAVSAIAMLALVVALMVFKPGA